MNQQKNYKKTLYACYLGFITQAISANFTPLLFLTFKNDYAITLEKLAMIPLVFYFTQLLVDIVAAKYADKIGARYVVVIGDDEIASDSAKLKNMETGEQTPVKLSELYSEYTKMAK